MAFPSRSHTRNTLLPSFMTAFLKRRLGQFTGFFMICAGLALAVILVTYHASDPSWNLAIDGPAKNMLAFPGAVVADLMLQTFGIAAGFWVIGFIGWGIRSIAAIPLKWAFFRLIALGGSVLLATAVAAQWTAPKSWLLPNSAGGVFGEFLIQQAQNILGASIISSIGVGMLFSLLSFCLLVLSLGIPFKQVARGFRGIALAVKITALFI